MLPGLDRTELIKFAGLLGEPPYRGRQLYHWLYAERKTAFEAMTDLPQSLRAILADRAAMEPLKIVQKQDSADGSLKLLLEAADNQRIESVLIPEGERLTACLSTQVGCAVGCRFCATGLMGFKRNLSAGEIITQVFALERAYGRRITNIVVMGMGEPLLNRFALFKAVPILTDPEGVGISRRKLTVSTAGWLPGIKAMIKAVQKESSSHFPRVKLALSLNCASDEERRKLMPLVSRFSLADTLAAAADYAEASGEVVSINYLLLSGRNDAASDAGSLARLVRDAPFKVNIMEYNDVGSDYRRASPVRTEEFLRILTAEGLTATVRTSRGSDIAAACGQLAGDYICKEAVGVL